ncbi:MAG: Ig-like domain-containing protein, partial [Gemmatimonadales bacterium]
MTFIALQTKPVSPDPAAAPQVEGSVPIGGATDVQPDSLIALRVSKPLDVHTVNATTVVLMGPEGLAAATVVPVEEGRLAFITPEAPLIPGATYTVTLDGPTDPSGARLPVTSIAFTVAHIIQAAEGPAGSAPPSSSSQPQSSTTASATAGGERGAPPDDAQPWTGEWRDGRPYSPWHSLGPLQAPPGVTALAGQVLQLNGQPLPNVTLRIGSATAGTDDSGRFLLASISAGHQELLLDARTANQPGRTYGVFEIGVDIIGGQTNVLSFTSWMPRIDTAHAVPVPTYTTSEVIVTTPRIPGLEVHLPPHSTILDHEGHVATHVSVTPIQKDRPPFPLPANVDTPAYFTIQPGAGYVQNAYGAGARLIYPNYSGDRRQPPGTRFDFWHYDPDARGWYIYGQGTVSDSGRQVIPDPGVAVYEFTGAMIVGGGPTPPATAGAPGNPAKGGDPVDLGTGLFVLTKT